MTIIADPQIMLDKMVKAIHIKVGEDLAAQVADGQTVLSRRVK